MKILITGGAGFIGANLSEYLLNDGHEVYAIDNFFSSAKTNIKDLLRNKKFHLIVHDIIFQFPKEITKINFDQIYHLACPASPPKYQKDHIYTLKTNFEGTLNVLEFAKKQKATHGKFPKFLFTSTSEVYGDPQESPQKENYRGNVNPHGVRSCYDEGKRVAESLCMNFFRKYKMPVKIVRIFNTYGPKMDRIDGRVISNFIIQALKNKPITIYGNGRQTRSFQYIDDLIFGLVKYMNLKENFPGPINLGNDREFTILELKELLEKIFEKKLKTKYEKLPLDDPKQRCPDISLAKNKLNWKPKVPLKEGLKKTIEYFKTVV